METRACVTGSLVWAAAAAIPALPNPDSLEKIPLATPNRTVSRTIAPAKPPAAAVGVKALANIRSSMPGISEILIRITAKPPII